MRRDKATRGRQEYLIPAAQTLSHKDNLPMIALLTVPEVAAILNCSAKTIYMWCDLELIPHYKLNGSIRFKREEIEEWLESCKHEAVDDDNSLTVSGSPMRKGGLR